MSQRTCSFDLVERAENKGVNNLCQRVRVYFQGDQFEFRLLKHVVALPHIIPIVGGRGQQPRTRVRVRGKNSAFMSVSCLKNQLGRRLEQMMVIGYRGTLNVWQQNYGRNWSTFCKQPGETKPLSWPRQCRRKFIPSFAGVYETPT
jgi:hypothetical protein